jgi:hypothetical protein
MSESPPQLKEALEGQNLFHTQEVHGSSPCASTTVFSSLHAYFPSQIDTLLFRQVVSNKFSTV